jgi:serine/threonine protein kinase/WD40 repeat protein
MSNHPRFFHRFETEARVIARLAHPRIVPLIDFWRDAEGAYLVLQYMPGRSVGDALERGTLDPESAHRIIRHVSQALEHAHDMGVAHGDVNPNNILLDESGNAYLADFDIASRLLAPEPEAAGVSTQADFRAPELGESGPTPAADIYAVGRLIETVVDRSAVRLVVERANRADPAERFANVRDLLEAFEEAIGGDTPPPPVLTRNPYKGLRPFEEADAADFHGREGLVSELIAELRWSKFVAVVGPSGSGKSSVVRAGVLPAIAKGAIDGAENWPTLQMTPGTRPLEVLADGVDALATGAAPPSRSLQRDGLSGAAEAILKDLEGELLVIVDQFEEAFTMLDAETRQSFIDLIVDAIEEEASRVRVIITLRADLYDLPLLDERLGPWLRASQVTVVPPTRDELIDMITAPGRNAGLEFARHLPGRIADDVIGRPGGLPLLQYALTEMIENRDSDLIDGDDYERVGGVAGALATRAEAVYRGLPSRLRDQARRVMLRLVAVDETGPPVRRRARLVELESLGLTRDDLELIISPYVAQRMLLADRDPTTRGPTVEVAHEALLREWPRLRNWIEDERESLVLSQKLRSAQREWETAEENPDFLLRGSHLARYLPLLRSESLTSGELDYLRRSRDRDRADQRKRRRRRRLVSAVLAGTAAAGLLLAAFATAQSRRAAEAADVARSRELASAAIGVLDRDPELSVLLATEAVTLAEPTFESVAALHEALYKHRLIWTVQWEGDTDFFTGALSPEGTRLALSGVGGVEVWDIATRRLVWRLPLPDGLHVRPFFSADGRELVGLVGWPRLSPAWDQPPGGVEPGIYRWGIETGEEIVAITDLPCPIWDMGQYGSAVDPTVPVAVAGFAETTDGGCDHSTGAVSLVDLDSGAITAMASIDSLATYSSSLSTTPDGKLVSFVDDGEGRVIDTVTGDVTLPIPLDVVSLTLTPDGSSAVVRDTVGRLTLWDLESGALQSQFGIGRGERFALNEEGSLVFHYDHTGEVEVWETEFGKPVASLVGGPPPPSRLVMGAVPTSLSRGDRVATFGDDGSARVWSTTPIAEVTSIPIGIGFVTAGSLTFSADRASLLIYQDVEETGSAPIFDPRSGEVVAEIDGVGAQAVRLSPDGRYLAGQAMSDGELGPIEVHNLVTGKVTVMDGLCRWELGTQFKNPAPCVPYPGSPFQDFARNIEFSPDSSLVALSGAGTGSVTVWDRASGELVHKSGRLMRHTENDPSFDGPTIAFAPDGGELAVATRDELLIIETDDWTISRRGDVERFIRIAYTPDGTKLIGATPTSEIQILDPAEIAVAGNIEGHRGRIHGIDVSPNGEMVASSSIDGVVMVWDIDNGMPLQAIPLGDELQNVAFLDSDHLLVTPQSGPSALVMTLNVAELIGVAQNRVTRDFTTEECQVYLHLDACPDGGGSPSLSEP